MKLVAAVEGGGTSFKVAICQAGKGGDKILHRLSVDSSTGDPATTLTRCALFLRKQKISALGIACFGPIGLNPDDKSTFGRILSTSPKVRVLVSFERSTTGHDTAR
jgi:fructokinase